MEHSNHHEHNHKDAHQHHSKENHHKHHNHHDHHKRMIKDFQKRFWVCLILSVPVILLSPMIQNWMSVDWYFTGDRYILFGLSSLIYFYGGWPFLKGLISEVASKKPGMMTLIGIAITVAYLYSTAVVFGLQGKTFFWELATLIDVMLIGHWVEMKSVLGASKALEQLAELIPKTAHVIQDDGVIEIEVDKLRKGQLILVKPGEKVPVDGVIVDGTSNLNESMLTGESKPASKSRGDQVIGGAINQTSALRIEVTGTGEETYLSKVITMVQEAQSKKSKTQKLADKAAFWLTLVALGVGTLTFIVWLVLGKELSFAMERMVTVMVISCPHALGLAVPLVAAISTSISAKNGLLIRNRTAFENSRNITTIIFDKTGTLTKGSHEVDKIVPIDKSVDQNDLLVIAAAIEQYSEHHISKGLMRKAKELDLKIPESSDFKYEAGIGVSGKLNNESFYVGGSKVLDKLEISYDAGETSDYAATIIYVVRVDQLLGYISFVDQIRESSSDAISTLQQEGINCLLLTGDNEAVAKSVATALNMKDYYAGVLPDQKQQKVIELQNQGQIVAMTGDGVNDAPALAQADVGIAIGSGTDIAAETADIILVDSDPKDIANLILFGRATYKKMIQNLIWATGYNVIAIPLAAGVLYSWDVMISPALGAGFMAVSTVICALNAQLLRRKL